MTKPKGIPNTQETLSFGTWSLGIPWGLVIGHWNFPLTFLSPSVNLTPAD